MTAVRDDDHGETADADDRHGGLSVESYREPGDPRIKVDRSANLRLTSPGTRAPDGSEQGFHLIEPRDDRCWIERVRRERGSQRDVGPSERVEANSGNDNAVDVSANMKCGHGGRWSAGEKSPAAMYRPLLAKSCFRTQNFFDSYGDLRTSRSSRRIQLALSPARVRRKYPCRRTTASMARCASTPFTPA